MLRQVQELQVLHRESTHQWVAVRCRGVALCHAGCCSVASQEGLEEAKRQVRSHEDVIAAMESQRDELLDYVQHQSEEVQQRASCVRAGGVVRTALIRAHARCERWPRAVATAKFRPAPGSSG